MFPIKLKQHFPLRFPEDLEQQFREDYFVKSLRPLRLSILLAAIIYGLFGMLDGMISPDTRTQVWAIRYMLVCPAILTCLLLTYSRHFRRYMQPVISCTIVLAGAGIVAMMVVVGSPINYFHNGGLVLVLMYTYTFSKLRFFYTSMASWAIVVIYELTAVFVMQAPLPTLVNDNFLFISANLIGMFGHYHRERYMRQDFLQNRTVRELAEKRHILEREKILRDLHDGLGAITTNIRLLAEMGKNAASPDLVRKTLTTISELSQEGLAEIKGFMQCLDSREITWMSLAAELRIRGRSLMETHGLHFSIATFIDDEMDDPPGSLLWLNLQRIYKEALTNVAKHSGGKNVIVDLKITGAKVLLVVSDDGAGIIQRARGGRGITNMRRRTEEIGGTITIAGETGTTVRVEIPMPVCYETREKNQGPPEIRPGVKAGDRRAALSGAPSPK